MSSVLALSISQAPRILGLDGNTKMSKSLNNAIYLKDSPEETEAKIKVATPDSETTIGYDPEKRPEVSNLVLIYALSKGISPKQAIDELGQINYSTFKPLLSKAINEHLSPLRERRIEIVSKSSYVAEILSAGRERALVKAEETMNLVRKAMKIDY